MSRFEASQLPAAAREPDRLRAGDLHLACLRAGDPADPVALLVPGYTGSKEDFAPVLGPLSGAGFHVVAIDLPGQYQSPSVPAEGYSVEALGAVVRAAAATLGAPVRLLGHSFGGLVARAAVIAEPGRFRSLVLLDSGPAAIQGVRRELIDAADSLVSLGLEGIYAALEAVSEPGAVPPAVASFLRTRFLANDLTGLVEMGRAVRHEPDRTTELVASGVPVGVVCGVADDAWRPDVQRAMAERLDAPFVTIAGAAHSPAVENPADTAAALLAFWHDAG